MPRPKQPTVKAANVASAKPNAPGKVAKPALAAAADVDAIALLEADHRKVEQLFEQFAAAKGDAPKRDLAIGVALKSRGHDAVDRIKHALGERSTVWCDDGAPGPNRLMAHTGSYAEWYARVTPE
jgi:hypothetical protein